MPIENHPSTGDVSSPGLASRQLDIACGVSGAGHHRNAGPGLFGLLFRIVSWMASEVLAGCERGLNAPGSAEAVIVGYRHDTGPGLAERCHQIFGDQICELSVMDVGAEQPFAALRRHFRIGRGQPETVSPIL